MNLKKLITCSLFLAIGVILHQITPPLFLGMKPDFLLSMMFLSILLFGDYKLTLIVGIAAGIFTAATTSFPGGQIPNLIDKIITANCVYLINKMFKENFNTYIKVGIISFIGTLISGTIFLGSAGLIAGLPGPFFALMLTVVIPATVLNVITTVTFYKIVYSALKFSYNK